MSPGTRWEWMLVGVQIVIKWGCDEVLYELIRQLGDKGIVKPGKRHGITRALYSSLINQCLTNYSGLYVIQQGKNAPFYNFTL